MAQLGPITVQISARLGDATLPVKPITFEVPLKAIDVSTLTDTDVPYELNLDRGELRDQMTKAVKSLGDAIDNVFVEPGSVILTCNMCGHEVATDSVSKLRHEADGAHSLGPAVVTLTREDGVITVEGELTLTGDVVTTGATDITEGDKA
jgi:hypothetical protein